MKNYPQKMKAVIAHNKFDYRFEEIPTPSIGPNDVLLKVGGCGICGGDAKAYYGGLLFWGDDKKTGWMKTPVIPGHEFIGTIINIGEGAAKRDGLKIGDKAIAEQILPCGKCLFCRTGKYWMCEVHNVYGFQGDVANGGMAEFIKLPYNSINHKVPHSLPDETAVAIEPVSIAAYATSKGNIELGDTVVIAGAGPIGLFITQIVRLKNPLKIVIIDPIKKRRDIALAKGADIALNPLSDDILGIIKDITKGYGCDVYIEAAGHPDAVDQGLQLLRKLGRFVALGVSTVYASVDWDIISDRKELTVVGAHLSPGFYPVAIEYLKNGKINVDGIITHRLKLEDFKKGFEMVHQPEESIKVVLTP